MSKDSVAEALRALADSKSRPETARLREVFDEIEAALASGVSRAAILQTLHDQGFTMTPKSFESALYRVRKQRMKAGVKPHAAPAVPAQPRGETPAAAPRLTPKEEGPTSAPIPAAQGDDLEGLTTKERRERRADQYIKPETTNPLLRNLKEKKQ